MTANPNPWNHPLCVYCGEPLTMNEFDFEDNRFYSSHFRCSQETPNGRFEVVTYRDGLRAYVESYAFRRYTTAKRAISQAEYLAFVNPPSLEFIVYDHAPESSNESAPVAIAHFVGKYSPMVKDAS